MFGGIWLLPQWQTHQANGWLGLQRSSGSPPSKSSSACSPPDCHDSLPDLTFWVPIFSCFSTFAGSRLCWLLGANAHLYFLLVLTDFFTVRKNFFRPWNFTLGGQSSETHLTGPVKSKMMCRGMYKIMEINFLKIFSTDGEIRNLLSIGKVMSARAWHVVCLHRRSVKPPRKTNFLMW